MTFDTSYVFMKLYCDATWNMVVPFVCMKNVLVTMATKKRYRTL